MKIPKTPLFFILLFALSLNCYNAQKSLTSFTPKDSILLDCGSSGDSLDGDNRKWQGDAISKYIVSSENSIPAKASYQDPSLPSPVPYMSAHVFTANATYSFPVTGGRHWIRLHFYPSSYSGLNTSDSYFSVTSGSFTLLQNFSVSITAQALSQAYIIREFSMVPSNGFLNLTFAPSTEYKSAYAFVNGIEIVSMPDIFDEPATLAGFTTQSVDPGNSALQTMFRLNVGGNYISPSQDSGLTRIWYDDTPYLSGAAIGVTFSAADQKVNVSFPVNFPKYIAPVDVYGTARSMGPDNKVNLNYNLTWVFQVDPNFMYIVRLHFCELEFSKINQRAFDIFVNNQTAQKSADVIAWTSRRAVPLYKDYAAYVSGKNGDDAFLLVALHPSTESKPEYFDAILNGLEVFKINDTAGDLSGPNPTPAPVVPVSLIEAQSAVKSSKSGKAQAIGGAAGGVAAMGLVFAICFVVYQQKRREVGGDCSAISSSGWLPIYGNSHTMGSKSTISGKSMASSHVSQMAANLCRHFSFAEIKSGTKNFDESLVVGVGGFGKVYKGIIDGGSLKVAIKRANPSSEQGVNEFQTEIEMLSKLRHRHLVSLIGYCEENNEMILVYDYMHHGTLREHLYKSNNPSLSWKQRLEICIGSARGLHYLHTGAQYTIIHRDVKTTNILLDEKLVAKVSDFGLSKTGPNMNQGHVSTMVKGSFGYLDPEYFRRQQLTNKSDVYSFGVVLFEVLCARPALNPSLPKEQVSLADWALHCQRKGILEDIIDPQLKGKINPECLKKFTETATKCLSDHGADRPTMGDVLWNLESALQLQENNATSETNEVNADSGSGRHGTASIGGESQVSEESDGLDTSAVFSQLINPKGR